MAEVVLNVDAENETGATALHERVGVRVRWTFEAYERLVAGPGGP